MLPPGVDVIATPVCMASGLNTLIRRTVIEVVAVASDHLIEDHQGTDIAVQIPGPTAADVLEEGKKSRCGRPLILVKRLNL
ncbi:hypothetical protein TNCV_5009761 [Trichonephila clavipes]|nr:hypothetical protein TNCV_5009761 [Trichonephila clavipes]